MKAQQYKKDHDRAMGVLRLIEAAIDKSNVIVESPYYKVFSTEEQRAKELIFMNKVILRLQSYYLNQFCKNIK